MSWPSRARKTSDARKTSEVRPEPPEASEVRLLCPGCANDRFMEVGRENALMAGPSGVRLVPTRAVVSCYLCQREFSIRLDDAHAGLVENVRQKPRPNEDERGKASAVVGTEMQAALDNLMESGPDAVARFRARYPVEMTDGRSG